MSIIKLYTLIFIINISLFQLEEININSQTKLRVLKPRPAPKEEPKQNTKILQTLYSDSYSKNYYTTLFLTDKKIKQTYLIDTGIATMTSPCTTCEKCGSQKKNFYEFPNQKAINELKCGHNTCKMLPANSCWVKEKNIDKKSCSFYAQKPNGDGLRGYYLSNNVYFEQDQKKAYSLPLGCTIGEDGKYKLMNIDGVMGLNNNDNSFSSLLFNSKVINKNIFSLCFGLEGGYMSLGEIDTTYHASKTINYVPLIKNSNFVININSFLIGNKEKIGNNIVGMIDTGSPITYLPKNINNKLFDEFTKFCKDKKGNNKCGNFQIEGQIGYCAPFVDRELLIKTVKENWPVITLELGKNIEYIWNPINYYYYIREKKVHKACLGFNSYISDNIILGSNFMHGYDMILDREKQLLGFVQADCSRKEIISNNVEKKETPPPTKTVAQSMPSPILDKKINKIEKVDKPTLVNSNNKNNNKEKEEFIKDETKDYDRLSDFKLVNYIILLISVLFLVIVLLLIIIVLIFKRKQSLSYQHIVPENIPSTIISEEGKESNDLGIQENNINEETNESSQMNDDNKVTNEDVKFLKKIMKKTHK